MSDPIFTEISQKIGAGTATASEILSHPCEDLSSSEKVALLTELARKISEDNQPLELSGVLSGIADHNDPLVVPAFLSGRIDVVDTDGTAMDDLGGGHQFVSDSGGDSYPEESEMEWFPNPGYYYAGRTLTIPEGVKVLYSFVLKP